MQEGKLIMFMDSERRKLKSRYNHSAFTSFSTQQLAYENILIFARSTLINVARVPFTCVGTYSIQGKFTESHIPASTICSAMFNEFILQSFRLIHLLRKWKDCQKLLNQKFRNKNGKSYPTRIVKTPKFVQTCSFNISCTNGLSCLYIFIKVW